MLVLLFLVSALSEMCYSQMVYMPRYVVRPVRRSAMDALERLRLPLTRYFPQVDTQVAPYQGGPPFVAGYPVGEVYNAPNQWVDDYAQQVIPPQADDEEEDYEYSDLNSPVYRPPSPFGEVYGQELVDTYGNLMDPYLMEDQQRKEEMFDVKRRRADDHVAAEKEESHNSTTTTSAPPAQKAVQMTAVPPAPEKKDMKSLVVPDQERVMERDSASGQKEEPLFRPLQSSQKTMWSSNKAPQKSPIPLLKKIIQEGGATTHKKRNDPLLDELTNLKRQLVF